MFFISTGEDFIKCLDPSSPFSSASKATKRTLRFRKTIFADSFCASSKNQMSQKHCHLLLDELCLHQVFLIRNLLHPIPMWSKCAPITIYSSLNSRFLLRIFPTTFAPFFITGSILISASMFQKSKLKIWRFRFWFISS